jgi:hypothetical protein
MVAAARLAPSRHVPGQGGRPLAFLFIYFAPFRDWENPGVNKMGILAVAPIAFVEAGYLILEYTAF